MIFNSLGKSLLKTLRLHIFVIESSQYVFNYHNWMSRMNAIVVNSDQGVSKTSLKLNCLLLSQRLSLNAYMMCMSPSYSRTEFWNCKNQKSTSFILGYWLRKTLLLARISFISSTPELSENFGATVIKWCLHPSALGEWVRCSRMGRQQQLRKPLCLVFAFLLTEVCIW